MDLGEIDVTDLDRFANGFPHEMFSVLRRDAPVWWQEPTDHTPDGEGFWVISRHADVVRVARDAEVFSSETGPGRAGNGGTIIEDLPAGIGPGVMLNMCDPPTHTRIRGLVSRDFTPKAIELLVPFLRARADALLDAVTDRGECDFLVDVAAELPLQTIAQIMGVPQEDRHQLFEWTSTILDYRGRDLGEASDALATAGIGMRVYGAELTAQKRAHPTDDMLSAVVSAGLSDEELSAFFSLLFTAGSETTRNSIAGGLLALDRASGPARRLAPRPRPARPGDRGDPALDERDGVQPSDRDRGRRARRPHDPRRAEDDALVPVGEPGRLRCSPTRSHSTSRAIRTHTWRSDTGCTTAWARRWPEPRSG